MSGRRKFIATTDAKAGEGRDLIVYFDGACPLCRREIAFFSKRTAGVDYVDISEDADRLPDGLNCEAALARFHVKRPDGVLVDGAAAFVELWERAPIFRRIAPIAKLPPVLWILERGYRLFLRVRPMIASIVRRTFDRHAS